MKDWQSFVIEHGARAQVYELAHVVGQPVEAVRKLRGRGVCVKRRRGKTFAELFTLWNGRAPTEKEWPRPRKDGGRGTYEWQAPEHQLLASLIGSIGFPEIAAILTKRLRKVTGDETAVRTKWSVYIAAQRIGLTSYDVVGGITVAKASRETGSRAILDHEIRLKRIAVRRVGRLLVIPYKEWERWKATRVAPPAGFMKLAKLKRALGIRSDKLSEWARLGYIPTAVRCNTYGVGERSTRWGSWWLDPKVARKLIADRRAGRSMPWWGKPEPGNLKTTWRLLQKRRHPASCEACRKIWGPAGAPSKYDDYVRRYPPLEHGAKRHLTIKFNPGLTIGQLAHESGRSVAGVTRAIAAGVLRATKVGRTRYVTRSDATRWKVRNCPTGSGTRSWLSLQEAKRMYAFSLEELQAFIADGRLKKKIGTNGPMRGKGYVPRQQCAELRQELGYTEPEAARRVGVSVARLQVLLRALNWRGRGAIPLHTINAAIKREASKPGYSLAEAAQRVGKSTGWVEAQVRNGVIRILRGKWNRRRRYVSAPMLARLRRAAAQPQRIERWTSEWVFAGEGAIEAGVSIAHLARWAETGQVVRRGSRLGWRYHRRSIRARARRYWKDQVRFKRATPPAWLSIEPPAVQLPRAA